MLLNLLIETGKKGSTVLILIIWETQILTFNLKLPDYVNKYVKISVIYDSNNGLGLYITSFNHLLLCSNYIWDTHTGLCLFISILLAEILTYSIFVFVIYWVKFKIVPKSFKCVRLYLNRFISISNTCCGDVGHFIQTGMWVHVKPSLFPLRVTQEETLHRPGSFHDSLFYNIESQQIWLDFLYTDQQKKTFHCQSKNRSL